MKSPFGHGRVLSEFEFSDPNSLLVRSKDKWKDPQRYIIVLNSYKFNNMKFTITSDSFPDNFFQYSASLPKAIKIRLQSSMHLIHYFQSFVKSQELCFL